MLVAVQVYVVPAVSVESVVDPQPVLLEMALSVSVTVDDTVTLPTYQLLFPSVPLTCGVTDGGVVSVGADTVSVS